jgi:hypothetical protein
MCKRSLVLGRLPGDPQPYLLYATYFSKDVNAVSRIQKFTQIEEITQAFQDKLLQSPGGYVDLLFMLHIIKTLTTLSLSTIKRTEHGYLSAKVPFI